MTDLTDEPYSPDATDADVAALRRDFYIRLDVTDAALLAVLVAQRDLVALARQWGWNDTEVRDTSSAIFEEAFGIELG